MLVLSRKQDSSIHIGRDVKVTILGIRGGQVKVGVEAPSTMPVWRDEAAPRDLTGLDALQEQAAEQPAGKPAFKVLLIEDDPGHAKLICRILRECPLARPIEVSTARTAEFALESLGMNGGRNLMHPVVPFDLILLDLYLPRMSGLDLLLKIRTDPHSYLTPVVFLTCAEDDETAAKCLDAGANAFVSKSGDPGEFRASVSRIADFWGHENRVPRQSFCPAR
ncbi:MAG: response regulator [Planctomycetota bacterium]